MRPRIIVVLLVTTLASIAILFVSAISYFQGEEVAEAHSRLSLYSRSVSETLQRYQHLPYVLARDALVIDVAEKTLSPALLNVRLREFAEQADLEAIYLMDREGLVLAASNFDQPHSFVGNNYGFRPYFLSSKAGQHGEFFGVGATTGRPGYFVSEAIVDHKGRFFGVIAIKLDMSELQLAWEQVAERVFVSNADGVVVLTSNRDWLYKLLSPLSGEQIKAIEKGRQFGSQQLSLLDWSQESEFEADFEDENYIYVSRQAERLGWKVHYLLSEKRVYERATLTTAIFGSAIVCLVLFSTFLRSRRISMALAVSQNDRAQLWEANMQLEAAQDELKKTSKLAALGQLSASVTHELGQPISALRNYITAAEINGTSQQGDIFSKLARVAERMEHITKQLRFFVPTNDDGFEKVDLRRVANNAIELLDHRVEAKQIALEKDFKDRSAFVLGNRLKLEQVLVNLLSNGIGAIDNDTEGEITVSVGAVDEFAIVSVKDNGIGIGGRSFDDLSEPFHTTKASGEGMGLGLSIASEIIREHNGEIEAVPLLAGGAEFVVKLPLFQAEGISN